jgi:hypothetical protein
MTCERRGYFTDVSLLLVLRGVGDTEKTQLVSNMSDVLIPSKAGSTLGYELRQPWVKKLTSLLGAVVIRRNRPQHLLASRSRASVTLPSIM